MTLQADSKTLVLHRPMIVSASRFALVIAVIALPLGGCSSFSNTMDGLFGGDSAQEESSGTADSSEPGTENSESGFVFGGDAETRPRFSAAEATGQGAPDLNSVPSTAPTPSPVAERDEALAGLIADRANARHTSQGARTMPVAVRPLEPGAGRSESEGVAAPVPDAAALDPVTRLSDVPPPRPAEAGGAAASPEANNVAVSPPPPARPAAGPRQTPTNIPTSSIAGNENVSPQTAAIESFRPLSTFDPGAFAVSSQVASLTSVARGLTPEDRSALQEAATLRSGVQGVIRVIGHGGNQPSEAAALAVRVAEVLRTMGVPADRLYVGADAVNGPVEVFLDY